MRRREGRGELHGRRINARRDGLRRGSAVYGQAGPDPRADRTQSALRSSGDRGEAASASRGDDASDRLDDADIARAAA